MRGQVIFLCDLKITCMKFRLGMPHLSLRLPTGCTCLMLFSPLFISEKLLFYYSLSFRLKGVKTNTLEAIHHRDTECTEENFFIVKNHKLLFTTEVTLSHPYNRDISACTSHRGKHLYCFKSEDLFLNQHV